MGEIVIEENNYKAFITVLAYAILLMGAIAITIYGFLTQRLSNLVPGLISAMVFFIFFIVSLGKALQVKKLLTITRDGIIDHSAVSGVGYISFDEIKEFTIMSVYHKETIAVIPKNTEQFLKKFNVVKRRLMKRNISMNLPPITIHVDMAKDMAPKDILTLLQKRLSDYSSLYD
ncbi:MAG TPA: STM3941 family protein [Mobilitalea sp.]|nr:STM3941 family protein [Mobilitalea sp.]